MALDIVIFRLIDFFCNPLQNRFGMLRKAKRTVTSAKDIVYDEAHPKACTLDLHYVKQTEKKYPVIFEIHGGGFVAGDKKYRAGVCSWFAMEAGAFVVNVNYGLGPKYTFPQPVQHLTAAMNWVIEHAEEYNLDLSKFIVTGDSAGGYYAAELCALQDNVVLQNKLDCHPKGKFSGIVLNCGLYDINRALSSKVIFNLTSGVYLHFTGSNLKKINDYKYLDSVSPISHITKSFPKSCVIYAKKDLFCGGQGEDFVAKLEQLGVYHEVYASTDFINNHTFPSMWKSKAARQANKLIISFIKNQFKQ
jgi:acetyl esterase/lipase